MLCQPRKHAVYCVKTIKKYCLQVFLYLILGLSRKWKEENQIYIADSYLCFTSTHPLCKHQSLKLVSKLRTVS